MYYYITAYTMFYASCYLSELAFKEIEGFMLDL